MKGWSPEPGLNQRHPVYKTGALPTELSGPLYIVQVALGHPEIMERETGIEPATNSLEGCDSTTELLPPEFPLLFYRTGPPLLY